LTGFATHDVETVRARREFDRTITSSPQLKAARHPARILAVRVASHPMWEINMQDDVEPTAEPTVDPTRSATVEPGLGATVESILDPRALQILMAEHSSLQADRSLVYNELFTRSGMFLTFVSISFVAIALVAQAIPVNLDFRVVAAVVLGFDFVVGLATYGRMIGASYEDYRAVYGMNRIRHAYGEIAPAVLPYFTTGTHDDLAGVMLTYGNPPTKGLGVVVYQLTTSTGMINLIVSLIGGVLALVVSLILEVGLAVALGVAVVATVFVFMTLGALTIRFYLRIQASIEVLFPTPRE
jgi:hypothetical protein